MAREELTRLTGNGNGNCNNDDCPNVYQTASGSFVVQGDVSKAFTLEGVQDFWLFDRSEVVLMNYSADGTQVSRELYDSDPAPYIEYQRIALAESVPFREYVNGGHRA